MPSPESSTVGTSLSGLLSFNSFPIPPRRDVSKLHSQDADLRRPNSATASTHTSSGMAHHNCPSARSARGLVHAATRTPAVIPLAEAPRPNARFYTDALHAAATGDSPDGNPVYLTSRQKVDLAVEALAFLMERAAIADEAAEQEKAIKEEETRKAEEQRRWEVELAKARENEMKRGAAAQPGREGRKKGSRFRIGSFKSSIV